MGYENFFEKRNTSKITFSSCIMKIYQELLGLEAWNFVWRPLLGSKIVRKPDENVILEVVTYFPFLKFELIKKLKNYVLKLSFKSNFTLLVLVFRYLKYYVRVHEEVAPKRCNLCSGWWTHVPWKEEEIERSWRNLRMRALKDWRLYVAGETDRGREFQSLEVIGINELTNA